MNTKTSTCGYCGSGSSYIICVYTLWILWIQQNIHIAYQKVSAPNIPKFHTHSTLQKLVGSMEHISQPSPRSDSEIITAWDLFGIDSSPNLLSKFGDDLAGRKSHSEGGFSTPKLQNRAAQGRIPWFEHRLRTHMVEQDCFLHSLMAICRKSRCQHCHLWMDPKSIGISHHLPWMDPPFTSINCRSFFLWNQGLLLGISIEGSPKMTVNIWEKPLKMDDEPGYPLFVETALTQGPK